MFWTVAVGCALSLAAILGTFSAFTATTTNAGNSVSSGTVKIDQHPGSTSLYNTTDRKPGEDVTGCVRVTYAGSLPAMVRLYRSGGPIANGSAFTLKVERGTGLTTPGASMSCNGFNASSTVYNGSLMGFSDEWTTGYRGKNGGAAWAQNNAVDYRFTITPVDDTAPNGHTAPVSTTPHDFTWQARNFGGYPAEVLSTPGLRSYWRLGEATGTTAFDATPSGNVNGTHTNGPTLGAPGAPVGDDDTAAAFDGVDDYVGLGNPAALQATSGTLETWVKSSVTPSTTQTLMHKSSAFSLYLGPSTGFLAIYDFGAGVTRNTNISITDGLWHHVAVTYRSGVTNGTVIYLDGTARLTTTMTVTGQGSPMTLAAAGGGTNAFLTGQLDDAAFYDRALAASEIKAHFSASS